jgi:hypothetical protein
MTKSHECKFERVIYSGPCQIRIYDQKQNRPPAAGEPGPAPIEDFGYFHVTRCAVAECDWTSARAFTPAERDEFIRNKGRRVA